MTSPVQTLKCTTHALEKHKSNHFCWRFTFSLICSSEGLLKSVSRLRSPYLVATIYMMRRLIFPFCVQFSKCYPYFSTIARCAKIA